jgi:carbon storage regulator CsrA
MTMLVLTRKMGEKLQIGRNVTFTVLGIKANRVRIGIEAPRTVSIMREELRGPELEAAVFDKVPRQRV